MIGLTAGLNDWWIRAGLYDPGWIRGFWLTAAFLYGSCMGSFLNVCVWRIPLGESIADAPSHCPKCGALIRWYDNIPIFSYLRLRGKCRHCGMPISPRYLIVETLTGLLFAGALAAVGWSSQPPGKILLYCPMLMLIITTAMIDWEHRIIPDLTTYPAMIFGVAVSVALPSVWGMRSHWWSGGWSLGSLLVAGIFLGAFAWLGRKIAGRDVMGWGDVKYLMAAGALLGIYGAFFSLLVGSFAGAAYGVAVALHRKRRLRRTAIPFGPFLAGGSLIWIFCGEWLTRGYFRWLGGQ